MTSVWQTALTPAVSFVLFAGAGFLARRLGWADAQTDKQLSQIIYYVAGPLLIFINTLERLSWELLLSGVAMVAAGAAVAFVGMLLSRAMMDRWLGASAVTAGTLAISCSFPNSIFLGLPVSLALVGPQAVPLVVLFDFGMNLVLWSWAVPSFWGAHPPLGRWPVARASSSPVAGAAVPTQPAARSHLLSPYLVGLLAGTVLAVSGAGRFVPAILREPLHQLGGITVPLALWVIGSRAAGLSAQTWNWRQAGLATLLRSVVLPGLVAGLALLLLPSPSLLGRVLVIEASMPTMASAVMYAEALAGDAQAAAVAVIATTVVFLLQLPALAWVVRAL